MTEHMFFFFPPLQLFRRVAAALPGMDTTQDKSREDSILCVQTCVCEVRRGEAEAEEPVRAYTLEDSFADLWGGTENLFHHTFKDSPNMETLLKPPNMQHWWSVLSLCISQSTVKVNEIILLIHLTLKTFQVEHNLHIFNTDQD